MESSKLPASNNNPIALILEKFRRRIGENGLAIAYKLLYDILFLSLLFFTLSLVAEGILPGIITSHVGFPKIVIFILFELVAIYFLGSIIENKAADQVFITATVKNKKTVIIILLIVTMLLFNTQLKINVYLNIFLVAMIILTGYFSYKVIFEKD